MLKAQNSSCETSAHKHCVESWRNLVRLWKTRKLCDVVINVKGRLFPCHSVVAASASPFFRRAFAKNHETSHKRASMEKEIAVNFMTPELFSQVLHFIYTAEIRIDSESARSLILAAGKLEMQIMINAIMEKILKWELDSKQSELAENVEGAELWTTNKQLSGPAFGEVKILLSSDNLSKTTKNRKYLSSKVKKHTHDRSSFDEHSLTKNSQEKEPSKELINDAANIPGGHQELGLSHEKSLTVTGLMDELRIQGDMTTLKKVRSFAARNFHNISQLDSFLETSVHTVACLLEDERVNMKEIEIFLALCKWLEAHQTHMIHAPFLLSKIRLKLLSPVELAEHVETRDYLMRKKKSRVQVLEAFRFHCLQSQSSEHNQYRSNDEIQAPKIRRGTNQDYVSDDEDLENEEKTMEIGKITSCPIKENACVPDYILLSGGIDVKATMPSDAVYKYEERHNWWVRFSKMPQPRNHHAAVYCKGALYVLGGSDPSLTGPGAEVSPVSSCHKLGLGSLKWSKIESMSIPRMSFQGAHMGDYIYAIGGQDHKQRILRDAERYSISTGEWEHSGSLVTPRAGLAVCKYKNRLWALGGYCHKTGMVLDIVEAYNEEHEEWETMPTLRFPRCFANVATCKRHIYVVGGAWLDPEMECSSFSSVYDVDIYNPASKVWEGVATLKIGRHDAGIAVLGSRIYIIGGKHCDDGEIRNLDSIECFDVDKDDWIDGIRPLSLSLLGPAVTYTC